MTAQRKDNPMPHAHTPGTWVVSKFKGRAFGDKLYIEASEGGFIADLQYDECATDSERELAEANARLIAAAPEMLEALQHCVAVFKSMGDRGAYPLELLPFDPANTKDNPLFMGKQGYHFATEAITRATGRERGA